MVHWSRHGPLPMLPRMDTLYTCRTHSGIHPIFSDHSSHPTPTLSHRDATLQAARELTHALQNLNNANPLSQLSDDQLRALHQLSTVFPAQFLTNNNPKSLCSHHTPLQLEPSTSQFIAGTIPESLSFH